jgi:hypothetical protein
VSIRGNQVRLGIAAPDSVSIFREELCEPASVGRDLPRPGNAGTTNENATPGLDPSPLARERRDR